jgi:hypothetical protein
VDFVVRNSNKLQKLGLGGKISENLNVFTLGPTTQVTLVVEDWMCEMLYAMIGCCKLQYGAKIII